MALFTEASDSEVHVMLAHSQVSIISLQTKTTTTIKPYQTYCFRSPNFFTSNDDTGDDDSPDAGINIYTWNTHAFLVKRGNSSNAVGE